MSGNGSDQAQFGGALPMTQTDGRPISPLLPAMAGANPSTKSAGGAAVVANASAASATSSIPNGQQGGLRSRKTGGGGGGGKDDDDDDDAEVKQQQPGGSSPRMSSSSKSPPARDPGLLPAHLQPDAAITVEKDVLLSRICIAMMCILAFFTLVFLANGDGGVVVGSLGLCALGLIGLKGTYRRTTWHLEVFWRGVWLWVIIFTVAVILYLSVDTMDSFAQNRCSQEGFARSYGSNCTTANNAEKCHQTCLDQVQQHLTIETIGFSAFIAVILLLLAHPVRLLSKHLSYLQELSEGEIAGVASLNR